MVMPSNWIRSVVTRERIPAVMEVRTTLARSRAKPEPEDPIVHAKRMIADARQRFAQVRDYTCTFFKRERIGGKMTPQYVMQMKARTRPQSIYFKFVRPNAGREAIYVAGRNGGRAIDFYKRAFGAVELVRMPMPGSQRVMHATLKIGGSEIMLSDEFPEHDSNRGPDIVGSTTVTIHLQVPNADKAFARAVEAGATSVMPPADMFWGDRFGKLRDPFGHEWTIAHHIRDVSPTEIKEAARKMFPPS